MNEIDKFFGDLPGDDKNLQNVFDGKETEKPTDPPVVTPEQGEGEGKEDEGSDDIRKNRRHRRLEDKIRQKDEMLIALNERVKVLSEVGQSNQSSTEVPAEWTALMGDSPEAQKAWQLQSKLLQQATDQAKQEALKEFKDEAARAVQEQKNFESFIDTELETLEEEHGIDLTSNAPAARKARREFLEMVQSLSPKDESGAITDYADFNSTFDVYKKTRKPEKPDETVARQKEIASKTMQKPSSSGAAPQQITPGFRGWMRDYNL